MQRTEAEPMFVRHSNSVGTDSMDTVAGSNVVADNDVDGGSNTGQEKICDGGLNDDDRGNLENLDRTFLLQKLFEQVLHFRFSHLCSCGDFGFW